MQLWQILLISTIGNLVGDVAGKNETVNSDTYFYSVLEKVYSQHPYSTTFLQRRLATDCVDEDLQFHFKTPQIIYAANETIYLKEDFSNELLAIACMNSTQDKEFLDKLAINLHHMRDTKIIIKMNAEYLKSKENDIIKLFYLCKKLKFINVILLHRDLEATGLYHSYSPFPDFELETRSLSAGGMFFPYRLSNLKGKVLVTLPDLIEPRTMLYNDASGKQQMKGYLAMFIHSFAKQYNCVFKFPLNLTENDIRHNHDLVSFVRNDSVDIGGGLSTPQRDLNIHEFSGCVEIVNFLNMFPIEPAVPMKTLLMSVFSTEFMLTILVQCCLISLLLMYQTPPRNRNKKSFGHKLLKVLCNDATIRGTLGQAFEMPQKSKPGIKFTYILLFVSGIFVSTTYVANLTQLITAPPHIGQISSYEELLGKDIKILMPEDEVTDVKYFRGEAFWIRYESVFEIMEHYPEFMNLRQNLNLSYIYPVSTSVFKLLNLRQKYFSRRLFRLSYDLYYSHLVFSMPINENSLYREPLNRIILHAKEGGFFDYWYTMAFYDLVAMGRMSFEDLSTPRTTEPFHLHDFYWIWVLYSSAMCVCLLIFLIETFLFANFYKK